MNPTQLKSVQDTALSLFQSTSNIFWICLPSALIFAILLLFIEGQLNGVKLESVFKRLIIAIILFVSFPRISELLQGLESNLVAAFGGDSSIADIFSKLGDHAKEIKDASTSNWLKLGQFGITVITTISFLILSVVKHFLDVLHLTLWNILHILTPLALLGCLFPSFSQIPKGIFTSLLELALWKPLWVLLARLLIAIGFSETPHDPSDWFDTAVMNFAVAGLMASTPALVHGFLSGAMAGIGGSAVQSMVGGAGIMLASAPMRAVQAATRTVTQRVPPMITRGSSAVFRTASQTIKRTEGVLPSRRSPDQRKP